MSDDVDPVVRRVAEVLSTSRSSADIAQIGEIERYRAKLASGAVATTYGLSKQRMQDLAAIASKSPRWAGLIFDLVVALRPTHVLEMGTAVGISGAYIAAALKANGNGNLVTVDANRKSYKIACNTFFDLGLDQYVTTVHDTFENALDGLMDCEPSFDMVFKDGEHSQSATTNWFDSLTPRMSASSAFLLDDIRRDSGMKQAWDDVKLRPNVAASVDFYGLGLTILSSKTGGRARSYRYGVR